MATKFADFSPLAQRVWAAPTVTAKTEIVLEMIDACRSSHAKKATFRRDIVGLSAARLDRFASDLCLVDVDRVIR
jgi:hypothetical protein